MSGAVISSSISQVQYIIYYYIILLLLKLNELPSQWQHSDIQQTVSLTVFLATLAAVLKYCYTITIEVIYHDYVRMYIFKIFHYIWSLFVICDILELSA